MSAKSITSVVMVLATLVGCGAPPETGEPDEGSTETESSALRPRDEMPTPLDHPIPSLGITLDRPLWDLRPYLDDFDQRPRLGGRCVMRYVRIYDPSRGRDIEVPVTVCN